MRPRSSLDGQLETERPRRWHDRPWEWTKQTLATYTGDGQGMIVHHDQDPVGVGYGWTSRLLLDEGVRVFLFTPRRAGQPRDGSLLQSVPNSELRLGAQRPDAQRTDGPGRREDRLLSSRPKALEDRRCSATELCKNRQGPTMTIRSGPFNHVQLLGCTPSLYMAARLRRGHRKQDSVSRRVQRAREPPGVLGTPDPRLMRSRPSASTLRGRRVRPSGTNSGSLHALES